MKISGFTFIRNGNKFDFPYIESIKSILPLVDELVIAVGDSDDGTLETIHSLKESKIKIIDTIWDENLRKGGEILSQQTNLALSHTTGDWCIYIQGDEVIHEQDYEKIKNAILRAEKINSDTENNEKVEGILLNYYHFYGNYKTVNFNRSSYRKEVRIVRNKIGITSHGDAQGFKNSKGEKLKVINSESYIYHYGWVRPQEKMKEKTKYMDSLYHGKDTLKKEELPTGENYKYKRIVGLKLFKGTHPSVMTKRISEYNTVVEPLKLPLVFTKKDLWKVISHIIEDICGVLPFEYKNYRLIK